MPGRRIHSYLCTVLLLAACSGGSGLDSKIDESSEGAVYLTRVPDRSFQAAHPIKIDPTVIARVLNGILIRDQGTSRRVLSGSEVGYLAPIISEGLRRAASDQQVAFRAGRSGGAASTSPGNASNPSSSAPSDGAASGVLYAYGRSLYVTLSQYRSGAETSTTANGAAAGSNPTVSFIPEAARRADIFVDARSTGDTLVIDYELLAMLPPASLPSAPAPSAGPGPQLTTSGGQSIPPTRDAEIEALRKELQEIKKQLAEQEAERARAQRPNAAPKP
jgi:hypothetical protein